MRFVMVTGMSGGGKSTAMRLLEDMGYYCVDNLPIQLIDKFVELLSTPNTEITKQYILSLVLFISTLNFHLSLVSIFFISFSSQKRYRT